LTAPAGSALLGILAVTGQDSAAAAVLAQQLGLPLLPSALDLEHCDQYDAVLLVCGSTLSLQQTGRAPGPVRVDFGSAVMRHRRRSGHNELLGRAVGIGKKPGLRVLDATAGLGRDSFVLADLGCQVLLCERQQVVAAMLRWGIDAAAGTDDPWLAEVMARMTLHEGDARELATGSISPVDVIYLDPMFPQRQKSAAVKKEMALFQRLLDAGDGPDDADSLLLWALQQDVARVVVKRPPRAPCLAARQPSHSLGGKAVRYDVYVRRGLASTSN
jgi:16S rRNA (guanine1516-N2)-methyltransferase